MPNRHFFFANFFLCDTILSTGCDRMLYIDFDGVIFNTNEVIDDLLKQRGLCLDSTEGHQFLREYDYEKILKEATEINGSLQCLKNLLRVVGYQGAAILTRINSPKEALIKYNLIQKQLYGYAFLPIPIQVDEQGIYHVRKKTEYVTAKGSILIDYDIRNIDDWIQNEGIGLYFTEHPQEGYHCIDHLQKVKSFLPTR